MVQIGRYLLVGCKRLRDLDVDHARRRCHVKRTVGKRLDFSQNTGKWRGWLRLGPGDVWNHLRSEQKDGCKITRVQISCLSNFPTLKTLGTTLL